MACGTSPPMHPVSTTSPFACDATSSSDSGAPATCGREASHTRLPYPSRDAASTGRCAGCPPRPTTSSSHPRIACTCASLAALYSVMAPNMLPWSVTATACMPAADTRLTRSFTFTAPSRSEYCEWTCRWTNSAGIARAGPEWVPALRVGRKGRGEATT